MKTLSTLTREAYRKTDQYRFDQLLAERSRWQRKQTIASNKLASVQRELDKLTQEFVNILVSLKGESK